jgi:hypothetical protein
MKLDPNEVFCFGANGTGFHGAGAAGLACRGESANTWRQDAWFKSAMAAPEGSPERVGKWAVYGVARGFQKGREGMSYAIQTVTRPGQRRSIPLDEIYAQLCDLRDFIKKHPEWTFIITPLGEGYAGYTKLEMDELWAKFLSEGQLNVRFVNEHSIHLT